MSGIGNEQAPFTANGNGVVSGHETIRLRVKPSKDHKPDSYEDLQQHLEFSPLLFSSLERYLPQSMLNDTRESKLGYMSTILRRYSSNGERLRVHRHKEYKQKIMANYQPLHRELYAMHAENFFVPSFLRAISENTEESFRSMIIEPSQGVYIFEMLQPRFCELLFDEVENFERWVHDTKFRIMRPNTMNKYGAVLDDFGMESMLDKLMNEFIRPMSKVFFSDVGGSSLDLHHGFVVEYGMDRDVELGFHVDDSEVTLNVCLGKQFSGGELFFRGVRCEQHVNSETQPEESFDYSHVPGRAVLHRGRHRHGARATTSGNRINLILWCRRCFSFSHFLAIFLPCKRNKWRRKQEIMKTKNLVLERVLTLSFWFFFSLALTSQSLLQSFVWQFTPRIQQNSWPIA
ncbi:2-oxoglutarate and iron-dependent oxygenase domain-containing protein CP2 isoform X1 [Cannabis sativa]|uniref:2-oxoglutarate and iron-dependent oxygenase domain-containing protein CP2 isoform X1 n=1 Tax=Cannabis sativa TaxID=3483 RepID=UPI0029CA7B99|nr:2-oxoglutarate and iron-dependent oxygenase domain-containing protein CP2 isoform X1 [Cannabis sativa]